MACRCTVRNMRVTEGGHEIVPAPGTVRRLDGRPGSVLEPRDFPLLAICMECGGRVREDAYMFAKWYHLEPEGATA